ncbi:DUF4489 domain-containing protein [Clostridium sp.]|uniref:DUF4489 domain-containing protein n=1 Tax=Clostridium sp. TaxID=1506 RepID=UPI002FC6FEDD
MKLNYNGPEKYEDKKYDCYKCEDRHEDKKYEDKKYEEKKCDYHQPCCEEHKYAKCYPMSPCPYGILFECAQGTMAKIQGTPGVTIPFTPRSLGCVSIDTSCLKMPVIKFDFNCVIQFRWIAAPTVPAFITFGLFKVCENTGEEIPCGTWDYRINFVAAAEVTNSFCFSHCECNSCPSCCTYYVKIVNAVNASTDNILDVMSPSLSVMAKSSC